MTTRITPFALSAILVFLLASCQITLTPGTDAAPSSGSGLEFRVTATQGLTQVRDSSDDSWRFLEAGDVLKPDCLVRTGFNSAADMVMFDNDREVAIRLSSLLPEMELHQAYDLLLAPAAFRKCAQTWVEKEGNCTGFLPLTVCRNALVPSNASEFLDVTSLFLSMEDLMSGRSAAGSGRACPT